LTAGCFSGFSAFAGASAVAVAFAAVEAAPVFLRPRPPREPRRRLAAAVVDSVCSPASSAGGVWITGWGCWSG
jgi:hypothetical protein